MYKTLKINLLKAIFSFTLVLTGLNFGFSQALTYKVSADSKVQITGTSSLHDWEMDAPIQHCQIDVLSSADANSLELTGVEFQLPVDQLKSEHKKMDEVAQKALKMKDFASIRFQANGPQKININSSGIRNTIKGVLEIAGVKKEVELDVLAKNEQGLSFSFSFPIHMEDYEVDPPKLMFGAITTGSDIQANFELHFNKINQ
ncbi:MAG: YceI family protein [Bacteroidales bacterium]|nr:YceI family protein [Bacteroidales bacterium]